MQTCTQCGETKSLDGFHRDARQASGYKPACKECRCAASREWRVNNPERCAVAAREWAIANRDKARAAKTRWRVKHPDRQRAAERRWAKANRDYLRQYQREWLAANPGRGLERRHRRRARVGETSPDTAAVMALLKTQPCAYCGTTAHITIDHIVPLARGGKHEATNLAPACQSCNASKGAKLLDEWDHGLPEVP